jgi:polysaccharide biosynthesis transport protein
MFAEDKLPNGTSLVAYPANPEGEDPVISFSQYVWIVKRHRWVILGTIVTCMLATAIISLRLTPIYESTATVDIDRRAPTGILGQESTQLITNDADQFIATQIKLIESNSVLRPVAEKYHLREIERGKPQSDPVKEAEAQAAPVVLKRLKVTRPPNTYLLLISYRSPDRELSANVANAIAESYLEHTYLIRYKSTEGLSRFMEKQLEELKAKMEGSSLKLAQFERELNVINPEEKTSILSSRLLQLNTEYTNAQTDRVRKEAAYASIRSGSPEAAQVSSQGEALKKLTEALHEAQRKFAQVQTQYGAKHPEYRAAESQVAEAQLQLAETRRSIAQRVAIEYREAVDRESMLEKAVAETKSEFDRLNARSFEYQTLKREADTDKKLYEELVRKIKEATINAGFQNSSIRIADAALPAFKPVFPDVPLNLVLAFLLSAFAAVSAAVASDFLNNTVRDPEQVSRALNTQVVGILPVVKEWRGRLLPLGGPGLLAAPGVPQEKEQLNGFDEAIRTLRNSILLTDFDRRLRTMMVTSASPSEGKSTIATYLAAAHAQQGRKTLLIDGDLRRPSVHRRFDVPNTTGLSDILTGQLGWRAAVRHSQSMAGLDVLVAGPPSRRATDLIGGVLAELLEQAGREYDFVVLDSPPLLGFPEPLQMAAAVDGVLLVALAGQTSRSALATAVQTLARLRANVVGVVLNSVRAETSGGYYYHYYHSKYYKYYHPVAAD